MRTSLRVFTAGVSTLLIAAMFTLIPFTPQAGAVNGVHTINVENITVSEATGSISFDVVLSAAPIPFDNISATIKPSDDSARKGQDYNDFTCNVSWEGGDDATEHCNEDNVIINDGFREPNERFFLNVVNPVSAAAGPPGSVTINDNEGGTVPSFTISGPAPAPEGSGGGTADRQVTVTLNNPGGAATTLNYATRDGSATSDSEKGALDYTKITTKVLTWNAGNGGAPNEGPIVVKVNKDNLAEPDERFYVDFGSPNNAQITANQSPANIDLINDDGDAASIPKLTLADIPPKIEGDTSTTTQTITVNLAPTAGQTVTVDYATSDGSAVHSVEGTQGDYTETKGTLTFPQGTTSKSFTVPVVGDPADETDETYHVTLSNPINATIGEPATKDATILNDDFGQITTVPRAGGGPHTRIFGATGSDLGGFMAIQKDNRGNDFTGGLHIARGDFFTPTQNGFVIGSDGIDEIVVGAGSFPPNSGTRSLPFVKIFAVDGREIASFFAYDQGFGGGVYVSAGNLDGDTSNGDELVVGAGAGGGPHVRIVRVKGPGDNIGFLGGFFAYAPSFPGGVRVAVADMGGDAKDEIVTSPGAGGGPHVQVFRPNVDGTATAIAGFMAYAPSFSGGVYVGAAKNRIVTGPGAGGGPHVRVFDGTGSAQGGGFMAYDPAFAGGVSVALGNLDNDPNAEVIVGPGAGGGPHVRVFDQDGSLPFGGGFFAYAPTFSAGIEVAVSEGGF